MLRVLTLLLALVSVLTAATTCVTGPVYKADGSLASGSITVSWQSFVTPDNRLILTGQLTMPIVAGVLNICLEPNDTASPAGTSYRAQYSLTPGTRVVEYWVVPTSLTPLSVSQVRTSAVASPAVMVGLTQLSSGGASSGQSLVWGGSSWGPGSPSVAFSASNVGTSGVGVFDAKTGSDLQFRKLNPASSKLTITLDAGNRKVDLDVSEAALSLRNIGGSLAYSQIQASDRHGDGAKLQAFTGTAAVDDCAKFDAAGNIVSAGAACGTATGGEINTASNVGSAGTGLFDAKVGVDLQFRKLNSLSPRMSIALDAVNKKVNLDVVGVMAAVGGTGVVKVSGGTPGLVAGSAGDCVKVDGSSGPCASTAVAASAYNFSPQTPGVSLTASVPATVTLTPVPLGVNGADTGHYLYVSGGTGTAEAVLITGGTAVAGAASGTITFTPANSHTGAWVIGSASGGVQEAVVAAGVGPAQIVIDSAVTFHAPVNSVNNGHVRFTSKMAISIVVSRAVDFPSGHLFSNTNALWEFDGLGIGSGIGGAITGANIYAEKETHIRNVYMNGGQYGVWLQGTPIAVIDHLEYINGDMTYKAAAGIRIDGAAVNTYISHTFLLGYPSSDPNVLNYGISIYSADGVWMTDVGATADIGFSIQPTSPAFVTNVLAVNCASDGPRTAALAIGGTGVVGGVHFSNSHFHGQGVTSGPVVYLGYGAGLNAKSLELVGGWIAGGLLQGLWIATNTGADIRIENMSIVDNNRGNTASVAAVQLATAQGVTIMGCTIGNTDAGVGHQKEAIALVGALSDILISGNKLSANEASPFYEGATTETRVLIANNLGVSDVVGTVASAATIALPRNDIVTITGTTGVGAVTGPSGVNLDEGRRVTLITTGGTVTFTAGATIGNTITSVQNVPLHGVVSGGKLYLK